MKLDMAFQHFDHQTVTNKFGGLQVTLEIAKIYLEESPGVVRDFQAARAEPIDYQRLGACAHTLKGSLGMMGACRLTDLALKLQEACGRQDEEPVKRCCEQLEHGLRDLEAEVEGFVSLNGD